MRPQARLRMGARIGQGGMAEVFAARLFGPEGFEKDVAVKRVLPRHADDPRFLRRFLEEARLAARLSHPNIVQIFELGNDGTHHYIVMEAVRGVTLRTLLAELSKRGERIDTALAVFITRSICAGLAHAHELTQADGTPLGIIHRDVSPHNVLLGLEGAVKLIDFGIARAADGGQTAAGQVIGKPHYLAPEAIRHNKVDARFDVFAVGVVLFEMLAGERPYEGTGLQVLDAIVADQRLPLASLAPTVPTALGSIVEQALAPRPKDRPQTVRALGAALAAADTARADAHDLETLLRRLFPAELNRAWLVDSNHEESKGTATMNVPVELTLISDVEAVDSASQPTQPASAPRRRRRWPAALGVVVLVLLVLLARVLPCGHMEPVAASNAEPAQPRPPTRPVDIVDGGVGPPTALRSDPGSPLTDASPGTDAGSPTDDPTVGLDVSDEPSKLKPKGRSRRKQPMLGRLIIETRPWSEVTLDGRLLGITPLAANVAVGVHTLTLSNREAGLSRTTKVTVAAGEPLTLRLDLRH